MKKLFTISVFIAMVIFISTFCYFNKINIFSLNKIFDYRDSEKITEQKVDKVILENNATVSLLFVGDIMLARGVEYVSPKHKTEKLFPFQYISSTTQKYDLTVGNLETPITSIGPYMVPYSLTFNSNPKYIEVLNSAGFDILSTANNHAIDKGKSGAKETQKFLKDSGLDFVGSGENCHDGIIKEINGIKIGFLAYSYTGYNDGGYSPSDFVCDWMDFGKVKTDVKNLKSKVDHVIILPHTGTEYSKTPTKDDEEKMVELINLGVTTVVGAHPHVTQRVDEIYANKKDSENKISGIIAYSLGNFVFDNQENSDTEKGLTLEIVLNKNEIVSKKEINIKIKNYCCPEMSL